MRAMYSVVLWGVLAVMPLLAFPMPTKHQEFLEALRARPNVDRGAQYFTTCAACHGPTGSGTPDGNFPRIGGQYYSVLVRQLVDFRHGDRWDFLMENFASRHRLGDTQAIADVAAYASQLQSTTPAGVGPGDLIGHGASVYFRLCEPCHGSSGQGDGRRAVPRIGGQHYEYLRRQIHNAVDGRNPGFPPEHVRLLARLDHDDIVGVADFLSRIPPRNAPGNTPTAAH